MRWGSCFVRWTHCIGVWGPHISFPKIGHFHFFQEKRRVKTVLIDFDRIEISVFFFQMLTICPTAAVDRLTHSETRRPAAPPAIMPVPDPRWTSVLAIPNLNSFFPKKEPQVPFFFGNPTTPGLGDLRSPLPTTYSTRMILQSKRSFPPSKMIQSFKKLNGFLQTAWSFVPSILQITRVNWSILLQPPGRTQTKKRFKPQNRGQTGSRYVYSMYIYIYKYKCIYI